MLQFQRLRLVTKEHFLAPCFTGKRLSNQGRQSRLVSHGNTIGTRSTTKRPQLPSAFRTHLH